VAIPLALALLADCERTTPGPATPEEIAQVRPWAHRRATELQVRLRAELMAALEEGGPLRAIDLCANRAQALTAEIGQGGTPPAELRRMSRRLRNPANAPDQWDLLALEHFERELERTGSLPEDWVQRLERDGTRRYRLYQPVRMGAPCLACHGDPAALSDTLRQLLAARYPADEATGYAEGDWRGLVRVELAARDLADLPGAPGQNPQQEKDER
jgi:hypothetical protein